jgi:hypothetical protein
MSYSTERIEANRDKVQRSYDSAQADNYDKYLEGDKRYCEEYIFENQKIDAGNIVSKFNLNPNLRAVSILKRTKVGMNGLMIELAYRMATHPDDMFKIMSQNIFLLTGMSNTSWETDFKESIPSCFKENVYHHGQLPKVKSRLSNLKNALIIVDEIDVGDKNKSVLHKVFAEAHIWDIDYIKENNIRFVFVSATLIKELKSLNNCWTDLHQMYNMTIPPNYIGHKDFLEMGFFEEFYPIKSQEDANRWVFEDIINNYGNDFRVHIIRLRKTQSPFVEEVCKQHGIDFSFHNSEDRIPYETLKEIFEVVSNHKVICVKGFWKRADLIPNEWKRKVGATHEMFSENGDPNVQVQGLPGRMTGYWRDIIETGHKIGPYRTSISNIQEAEAFYENPETILNQKKKQQPLMIENINGVVNVVEPVDIDRATKVFDTQDEAIHWTDTNLGEKLTKRKNNIAPITLQLEGNNPTEESLHIRMWGLGPKTKVRMAPINDNKWCIYWRPSTIRID